MKTLHTTLTVLTALALIVGLLPLYQGFVVFNYMPSNSPFLHYFAIFIGNVIGYLTIPAIFFTARYFVGKKLAEKK
jgi:uncharacterized membrane protein